MSIIYASAVNKRILIYDSTAIYRESYIWNKVEKETAQFLFVQLISYTVIEVTFV